MALQITLTDAGIAEIVNAENTGTAPVTIDAIGVGSGQYAPTASQTALVSEIKQIATISGAVVSDDTIHVTIQDESSDAYDVGEFGLYTDSGTLLAVYSQESGSGWIIEKGAGSTLLLAVDIKLDSIDAASLTFGDASFLNPPATETVIGVIEIADNDEALLGEDDERAMTPLKSRRALQQFGIGTAGTNPAVVTDADFNEMTTSGLFFTAGTPTNGPAISAANGHLIVNNNSADETLTQLLVHDATDSVFFRRCVAGSWGSWQEFAHTGNMPVGFSENNYLKLHNGLIYQWGGFTSVTNDTGANGIYEGVATAIWPIKFPNDVLRVVSGGSSDVGGVGQQEQAWYVSLSAVSGSFRVACRTPSASISGAYIAIGY